MTENSREHKNSTVFGGTRPDGDKNSPIPVMSQAERMKADFGVDLPTDLVPLPSKGLCYPVGHPLNMKESVEIRPMTTREESIIMNRAFHKKGTTITELIRSCLTDPSIDPAELLSGDRNTILVAIRITGYGAEYPVEVKCSECDAEQKFPFDLSQLPVQFLDLEPTQPGTNNFEFTLPVTKKVIGFRFQTGVDEQSASQSKEQKKKLKLPADETITDVLLRTVVSLDGNNDRARISQFVKGMPARDSLALRTYIRDHEPSIVFRQEITCESCENTEEVVVPLGVTFLWPDAGGR